MGCFSLRFCPSVWPREGDVPAIKSCPPLEFAQMNLKCDRVCWGSYDEGLARLAVL